jgi:hypothetical protein
MVSHHIDPLFDHQFCYSSNYYSLQKRFNLFLNYLFSLKSNIYICIFDVNMKLEKLKTLKLV